MTQADERTRKITGWCGIALVTTVLVNGPLSQLIGRTPAYWGVGAAARIETYLADDGNVEQMVVFFALSNLIFVFGTGFFAGLRSLVRDTGEADWVRGVIAIGAAIFLAGGLLSETLSTGVAVVIRSTPDYQVETNEVLLLQGLWSTALAQGQVALGVVVAVFSVWAWRSGAVPALLCWLGIGVGVVDLVRPVIVTEPTAFIASFQPTFLWIACVSVVLVRTGARRRTGTGAESPAEGVGFEPTRRGLPA